MCWMKFGGLPIHNTLPVKDRLIECDVVDHFVQHLQCGQTPCVCSLAKVCDQFNNDMLSRLHSKAVEVQCSDRVDDTLA